MTNEITMQEIENWFAAEMQSQSRLAKAIMAEGFGDATTARGCRGAIRRGIKRVYGKDTNVFERQGWYSDATIIGSEEVEYEWAIAVCGQGLDNPKFYAEPETGTTIGVYPI